MASEPHAHRFEWRIEKRQYIHIQGPPEVVGFCACGKKTTPGRGSTGTWYHRGDESVCTAEENRQIAALYASVNKPHPPPSFEDLYAARRSEERYLECSRREYQERLDEIESNRHEDASELWRR